MTVEGIALRHGRPGRAGLLWAAAALLAAGLGLAHYALAGDQSIGLPGALLVAAVLWVPTVIWAGRLARAEVERIMAPLVALAFGAKLVASGVYFTVVTDTYGGGDSKAYYQHGTAVASQLRDGLPLHLDHIPGTGFIEWLCGVFAAVIGNTELGLFVVFTTLSFFGQIFFYRAFVTAVPSGNARRYGVLILFMPSMLFWPSAIGKEAWMIFALGLTALGAALLLTGSRGGWTLTILGSFASALVRPHVSLLVLASLLVAYALDRRPTHNLSRRLKVPGIVLLGALTLLAISQVQRFLGDNGGNADFVQNSLQAVQQNTARGGSTFGGGGAPSLASLPGAILTVLFRPWPYEAANALSLLASLEGVLLLVLLLMSLRNLTRRLHTPHRAYAIFAATYVLLFCLAFSSFSNFGLLVRERTQVLPFVLVLTALGLAPATAKASQSVRPRARTSTASLSRPPRRSPRPPTPLFPYEVSGALPSSRSFQTGARSRPRQARGLLHRAGWTGLDQALSMLSNVAITVLVARWLGARQLGAFAVTYATYIIVLGLSNAVTSQVLAIRFSASDVTSLRTAAKQATGTAITIGIASGSMCCAAGLLLGAPLRTAMLALGFVLPGLVLQDCWRYVAFTAGLPRRAALNDFVWCAGQGLLLWAVAAHAEGPTLFWLILAWGFAALVAAAFGISQFRIVPNPLGAVAWLRDHRTLAPALAADFAMMTGGQQVTSYAIASLAGLRGAGGYRGAQTVYGPVALLTQAATTLALPETVRAQQARRHDIRFLLMMLAVVLVSIAAACVFALSYLPSHWGHAILGSAWPETHRLLLAYGVVIAGRGFATPAVIGIRVLQLSRGIVRARALTGLMLIGGGLVGALMAGASGAVIGLAVAQWLGAAVWWQEFGSGYARVRGASAASGGKDSAVGAGGYALDGP